MSKFKVGDKVIVTKCINGHEFRTGEVVRLTSGESRSWRAEKLDGSEWWHVDVGEIQPMEKTMDNLQEGDVLINSGLDYKRIVEGQIGSLIVVKDTDDNVGRMVTIEQLVDDGWKLKDTSEATEMTVEEVAKKLNIDNLKIVKG